jgi:hypothetical protein
MTQRLSTMHRLSAKRNVLAVSLLAGGTLVARADPAAARIALDHNETPARAAG